MRISLDRATLCLSLGMGRCVVQLRLVSLAFFLIGVVMLMLPDLSQGSAAMRPLFEIIGIVANWTLIASAIAMLISMLFMLRLAYTYIDPDHFDYQ